MQKHLENVLQKEVSRKEFLSMSGLAVASIMGLGTVVKVFTGHSLGSHNFGSQTSSVGYGGSAYGGNKK